MLKLLIIPAIIFVVGCSSFKADPGSVSEFSADSKPMLSDNYDKSPFHRGWASREWKEKRGGYNKIIVAPVDTNYLAKNSWWKRQNLATKTFLKKDKKKLANYFKKAVRQAYSQDPNQRLEVVDEPGPGTLVLELAIVELVPSKAFLSAISTVGDFFVPGASFASSAGKGVIAIEGRVKDSVTGEILAKFADRELDKSAPVNLAKYSWYRGSKQNMDDWAEQLVALINTPVGEVVDDSSPFTLKPW